MHIENDDIFVALSPLGLQPAGCLSLSTEILSYLSRTGKGSLIQASLFYIHFDTLPTRQPMPDI